MLYERLRTMTNLCYKQFLKVVWKWNKSVSSATYNNSLATEWGGGGHRWSMARQLVEQYSHEIDDTSGSIVLTWVRQPATSRSLSSTVWHSHPTMSTASLVMPSCHEQLFCLNLFFEKKRSNVFQASPIKVYNLN